MYPDGSGWLEINPLLIEKRTKKLKVLQLTTGTTSATK